MEDNVTFSSLIKVIRQTWSVLQLFQSVLFILSTSWDLFNTRKNPHQLCNHQTHSRIFKHWWKMVTSVWKRHFCNLFVFCCSPLRISFIWGAVLLTIVNKRSIKFPSQEQGVIVIEVRVRRFLVWVVQLFSASPLYPCSLVRVRYYAVTSTLNINLHYCIPYSGPTHMSNPFCPSYQRKCAFTMKQWSLILIATLRNSPKTCIRIWERTPARVKDSVDVTSGSCPHRTSEFSKLQERWEIRHIEQEL